MTVSHDVATTDAAEDVRSATTADLVERISANYRQGEAVDAAAVFELANRAIAADPSTPTTDGRYEDGMWVESF